jgi:hypothetical protein
MAGSPEQSASSAYRVTDRNSEMTHLRSVHPQPSAVAPTVKSWFSTFPIVTKLWLDLFEQLLRSYLRELPSGTQVTAQHLNRDLTTSAPDSPPGGLVRAAGLLSKPAAPSSASRRSVEQTTAGQITCLAAYRQASRGRRHRGPSQIV